MLALKGLQMIAIFALSCRIVVGVRTPNSRARDVTLERGKCKFQAIFFFQLSVCKHTVLVYRAPHVFHDCSNSEI